eukprot:178332_1
MSQSNGHDDILEVTAEMAENIHNTSCALMQQWRDMIQRDIAPPASIHIPQPPSDDDDGNHNTNHSSHHNQCIHHHDHELERQHHKTQKEMIKLQHKYETLQGKYKELEIQNSKLKLVVRGLAQIARDGPRPQFDCVRMMKNDACSEQIGNIKRQIQLYFHRKSDSIDIDIKQGDHPQDNDWIDDNTLKSQIAKHIQMNGVHNCAPKILINKNDTVNAKDLMEVYNIHEHRVKALMHQVGVRAKRNIPKGTVIGQYTGTQYLSDEFERIFEHSTEYDTRNMYAFDATMYVPSDMGNDRSYEIIIDGYDQSKTNQLIYINDCRKDIDIENPTKEDMKYWNCSFRTLYVSGCPAVYVLSRRDIRKGEELNTYYGARYGTTIRSKNNYESLMGRIRGLVDDSMIAYVGMEAERNDVYILD